MRPSVMLLVIGALVYVVLSSLINAFVEIPALRSIGTTATLILFAHYLGLAAYIRYHDLDDRLLMMMIQVEQQKKLERENAKRLKALKKKNEHKPEE